MRNYLQENGIAFRLSCPYTSAQNGKVERTLRTLNNSVCAMLVHAHVPPAFWAEALATATYLVNRRPCRATGTVTQRAVTRSPTSRTRRAHRTLAAYASASA
jgi:hypothetical protein